MDKIVYKGVEYELVFNLNVMEELQEEYGTVEEWSAKAMEADEPNVKVLKFGFKAMINEAIDIYNEEHEDKKEYVDDKKVGRIITEAGFNNVADLIAETVIGSTKSDDEPKNQKTTRKSPKK
jgi:hypothetical protein